MKFDKAKLLVGFFVLSALQLSLSAQGSPGEIVPAPRDARLVLTVEGRGTQNYVCATGPSGPRWKFTGPTADLLSQSSKKVVGHHDAGPTWTMQDGSSVKGTVMEKADSADPRDVPSLLLSAAPGSAAGVLGSVAYVRRYDTHGGSVSDSGCDAAHLAAEAHIPYTATYSFYTGGTGPTH